MWTKNDKVVNPKTKEEFALNDYVDSEIQLQEAQQALAQAESSVQTAEEIVVANWQVYKAILVENKKIPLIDRILQA